MRTRSRTPRPPAGPLTRRRIAEAALAQIDADGLEALSMRKLGAALGVEAMAVYHHFRSKGELLDAVLELLVEEMEPPADARPPLERIRRMFEASRRLAIAHPHAYILIPTRRFNTDKLFAFYERVLGLFRDAGFDARSSAHFFRLLASVSTGAGLAEVASRAQQAEATPVKLERLDDPARYPLVSAVSPHLRVNRLDELYRVHLDIVFAAMRQWLEANPAAAITPGPAAAKRSRGSRASKRPG